jgi:AraC-like DNA-binding protein
MKHPLLFNFSKNYPNVKISDRIPATSSYIVNYTQQYWWQNDDFNLALQDYDAKDAYLSLIEIKTTIPLKLPISCLRSDLYWFYQLSGASLFKHPDKNDNGSIIINEKEYNIVYASKGDYLLVVQPGHHLFLFFVISSLWFLRQSENYYHHFEAFRKKVREKPLVCKVSKTMNISYSVLKEMIPLLNMKKQEGITMETKVYDYLAQLINISHADKSNLLPLENPRSLLANTLREIIKVQIQEGEITSLKEIAYSLRVTVGYLRLVHIEFFQISPQAYFIDEKIKEAMRLLNEGFTVKEATFRLGYSHHSSLYKPFKKKFGISPQQAVSKRDKKP